ncbi:MAG: hypothetical protein HDR54_00765 [Treponema sp.]|nr:hypothetical protein [Treponema sp.]
MAAQHTKGEAECKELNSKTMHLPSGIFRLVIVSVLVCTMMKEGENLLKTYNFIPKM